jgi:hypothetical protein
LLIFLNIFFLSFSSYLPSLSVPYPLFPHLSLVSHFLIHYFPISPSSLSSLSIISSSLPRLSVPYSLFPHLSLVSQFLIHYFFISPSTLSSLSIISSSLPRLSVPYPLFLHFSLDPQLLIPYCTISSVVIPLFYVLLNPVRFYLICSFLNPSLLSFLSSVYFFPFRAFFPHHTFSAIFSRSLLLSTTLSFCSCRMRRAERCRPLAAP